MKNPLPYDDQDDVLQSQFNQLLTAIFNVKYYRSEEDIRALNELIQHEVTAKPNLARIIKNEHYDIGRRSFDNFLLWDAITRLDNELSHTTIKFLIEANPSALLWETYNNYPGERMIHNIAGHPTHCVLMPWIATNHQWVLDHEICLQVPPVFDFLNQYASRNATGATECTGEIIRQFFEAYHRGLSQQDVTGTGFTPLHAIVYGSAECEEDLFTWMAEKCPSNMLKTDGDGETPLHDACRSLDHSNSSGEICKYLIAKCPESVRIMTESSALPIHELLSHCQHRRVKEVVVCLLRAYPESYNIVESRRDVAPSSIPFVRRIKPLLDEERELKENVAHLQEVSETFFDAVNDTKTPSSLISSTCETFVSWATVSFVKRLEARIKQISMQIQHECNVDDDGQHAD